jgi:hypothetical protein
MATRFRDWRVGQFLQTLALTALCVSTLAHGNTPAAEAIEAAESAPKQRDYSISFGHFVLLPSLKPEQVSAAIEVKEGETIFKAPIAFDDYAINLDPFSIPVGGAQLMIPSQINLSLARGIEGGDSAAIPKNAVTFCSRSMHRSRDMLKRLKPDVQKDFKARFTDYISACFMDSDADRKFDKMFVVGAKMAEDRRIQPMAPIPYRVIKDAPLVGNSYLKLVYSGGDLLAGQNIDLHLFLNGLKLRYDRISFPANPDMPDARWYMPFKADSFPVKVKVGSAALSVHSVSPEARTAKISIASDFTRTPFRVHDIGSTMNLYFPVN